MGLLLSCTSTFGLCIWTAVHSDVVPVKQRRARVYYKLSLMLFAALVPEFVLYFAVAQRIRARKICGAWRSAWENQPEYQDWLQTSGAFFAVMGGFVVKVNEQSEGLDLVTTIRPSGFEKLLEHETFKDLIRKKVLTQAQLGHQNIEDKGKASDIAKLVVAIQILWMVVQCIGRKATGLPVTLLEAHILIQILYSVIAYFCWWEKPLDIGEPIALSLDSNLLSLLGHDVNAEGTGYFRKQYFITERRDRCEFLRMSARAAYDIGANYPSNIHVWATIMAIINGVLHATVWNSHFPTSTERLLWRISALGLGAFPLALCLAVWEKDIEQYVMRGVYDLRFADGHMVTYWSKAIVTMLRCAAEGDEIEDAPDEHSSKHSNKWPAGLPIWSRFLVVGIMPLGRVGVRSLPAGAYSTPRWSNLFPHF
ncbi:uncharacterized protein BDW43DRAFT_322766 [Aspergillus alliaceus]|uniref:uncharacterized protein n=1 Tax=Petromyces alliaceus TaxID=209559 RepID=UPI0012A60FF7|nr:uncharacterized protein BDW43DRAFT_322766 [Aspergillus alliaceus]KAB8228768.1 hypothetical protein BDW43DRAFT_322766 [Aspergillus alliaceus]